MSTENEEHQQPSSLIQPDMSAMVSEVEAHLPVPPALQVQATQAGAIPIAIPVTGSELPVMAMSATAIATTAAQRTTPRSSIRLETVMERSNLIAGEGHDTMVGVHIAAPSSVEEMRASVDCVVVSDVSGSMRGEKLRLLKDTTKLLVKELSKQDRLGLVTFDSYVKEPLKLGTNVHMDAGGRSTAEAKVSKFKAGTQTNLSGGLFAGVEQFSTSESTSSRVKTLLLLTDGMANQGVTDRTQLMNILQQMLRVRPDLTIHTFGYGSNHQSDLLRDVAESGSGSYYFVENNDDIRTAFGDCLGGVLSVVAQNIVLEVEALGDSRIRKIHHPSAECQIEGRRYTIRFNDLYGEEERDILVSLHIPPAQGTGSDEDTSAAAVASDAPQQSVLQCSLKYIDVLSSCSSQANTTAKVGRPTEILTPDTPNPSIVVHRMRVQVVDALDLARRNADTGDLESARSVIQSARAAVEDIRSKDTLEGLAAAEADVIRGLRDDLIDCGHDLSDQSSYALWGQHKMSSYAAGHQMQRCMESSTIKVLSSSPSPLSPPVVESRFNAYRTSAKRSKGNSFMTKK